MEIKYKLPDDMRELFKKPIGKLVTNPIVSLSIHDEIDGFDYVICVGDIVTDTMIKQNIYLDVSIIDGHTKRKVIDRVTLNEFNRHFENKLQVENEAGVITTEACRVINVSLNNSFQSVLIEVDGEEDLLILPVIKYAPENSIILYGQPNEGIVFVKNDKETVDMVNEILERMKVTE